MTEHHKITLQNPNPHPSPPPKKYNYYAIILHKLVLFETILNIVIVKKQNNINPNDILHQNTSCPYQFGLPYYIFT